MDLFSMAAIAALIMLAAFIQGVLGFGFGMVSMATVPLLIGVKETVPVVACVGLMLNVVLLVQLRDALVLAQLRTMVAGGLLGIPLGVLFLQHANPQVLLGLLGGLLLGLALWLGRRTALRQRSPWVGMLAGLCGGVLGGAFNTGGPPVIAYVSSHPWPPRQMRATLQAYFFLLSTVQLSLFAANGMLSTDNALHSLGLLIPLAVGALLGDHFSSRLPPERFRLLVRIGLAILGIVMISRMF